MSSKPEESASQGESDDTEQAESWLRRAAAAPPSDVPQLPRPGDIIGGKYRIERQLGKGGMGAVYQATHVVSEKSVALKWMLRSTSDEESRARFTREARAAGRIDHPNVVDVYDIGEQGGGGYLVMELLHGESLRDRLSQGTLSPTAVVDLLLPAMRGVAAAHSAGVVHRDLKPDNIFLCRSQEGTAREAKVLDFGISSIRAAGRDSQTTLTKEGVMLGTLAYMSPEQIEDVREADARSDVYSFGVILFEALTGRTPFQSSSFGAMAVAIVNGKAPSPRELRPELSVDLERVVQRAMDRDRERRLPNMEALIAALLPFASVRSSGAGAPSSVAPVAAEPTLPASRSRRWLAPAIGIALAVVLAWWLIRPAAREMPPAPARVVSASNLEPAPAAPPTVPPIARPSPVPAPAPAPDPVAAPVAAGIDETPAARQAPASGQAQRRARSAATTVKPAAAPDPAGDAKRRAGAITADQL